MFLVDKVEIIHIYQLGVLLEIGGIRRNEHKFPFLVLS